MTLVDRIFISAVIVLMLAYFVFGIWIDDLPLPGFRAGGVAHVRGISIWMLLGAFLCYLAYLVWFSSEDNITSQSSQPPFFLPKDFVPRRGGKVGLALACAGWLLFVAALIYPFFVAR